MITDISQRVPQQGLEIIHVPPPLQLRLVDGYHLVACQKLDPRKGTICVFDYTGNSLTWSLNDHNLGANEPVTRSSPDDTGANHPTAHHAWVHLREVACLKEVTLGGERDQ